jgi:hypothetical protein
VYVPWYTCTYIISKTSEKRLEIQALSSAGATGKLVGVVSIKDSTVYYGSNSTAMSAARISTTILVVPVVVEVVVVVIPYEKW